MKFLKIIIPLIFLSFVGYFFYAPPTSSEIRIIKAEGKPTRIRPKDDGDSSEFKRDSSLYEDLFSLGKKKDGISIKLSDSSEDSKNTDLSFQTKDFIDLVLEEGEDNKTFENSRSEGELNIIKIENSTRKIKLGASKGKSGEGFKIQLASIKSESQALKESEEIRKKYSKIFGEGISLALKKAGTDDSIFYLILAGNYPSQSKARKACKELIRQGQPCLVYNP